MKKPVDWSAHGLTRLPGRRFLNLATGETLSRRQAEKLRNPSFRSFEAKARAAWLESPTTQAARPARGRKAARTLGLTPEQVRERTRLLAEKHASGVRSNTYKNKKGKKLLPVPYPYALNLQKLYAKVRTWTWVFAYYVMVEMSNDEGKKIFTTIQPTRYITNRPDYEIIEAEIDNALENYAYDSLEGVYLGLVPRSEPQQAAPRTLKSGRVVKKKKRIR